jgi:hypothetical protein
MKGAIAIIHNLKPTPPIFPHVGLWNKRDAILERLSYWFVGDSEFPYFVSRG